MIDEECQMINSAGKCKTGVERAIRILGYKATDKSKYVRKNLKCPICGGGICILECTTTSGEKQGKEFCGSCNWYSGALQSAASFKKRTNSTLAKWSDIVKRNYGNECALCGSKENLNAHHIFPVQYFPEYKYTITNGIALCERCHKKLHGIMR